MCTWVCMVRLYIIWSAVGNNNWLMLQFCVLLFIVPLIFIAMKDTKKEPGFLDKLIQMILWEAPLLIWIYSSNLFGGRALEV
jgi:hypothetical protein